ncbi:HesA/MoeB/ThiF family protein [Bowmanella yangjiangensis]|uniref:HesA/MoeB/ThiF family protein n=1 Tax=Bowmanella yangjiangensis TaxID=2811230 RepID=A0ABS3CQF4_9ALTE|nr:HesA/MoeB/ThiF family protein [Bowmanella yangjiangensis]MBN7818696.1 HesA/MoeB/ThiF family protein [Bowmanella yangjiangensis]
MLNDQDFMRYSRHLMLEDIEEAGQQRLKQAKVLIIGLGGLGSVAAHYLAGAGVGKLVLADGDKVDVTNLHRQPLFDSFSIGYNKAEQAKRRLACVNPHIDIEAFERNLDASNLLEQISHCQLVLDCTDNMASRQAINAACYQAGVPLLVGAAIRFEGQFLALNPAQSHGCYRCLYHPEQSPSMNCTNSGVVGPVVGIVGLMQALEAIKYLTGAGSVPFGQLKLFDAKVHQWQSLGLNKDPHCPVCGDQPCN